ncbi:MAG: RidA family protein [Flavobacterium sp.]|nr:RidA family protein [Flavobacterium sp.]
MKKIIHSSQAPAPIGPYNQAILAGNMLYTSGQIALNPVSMELVLDSIEAETKQVMDNLVAVLAAAEMSLEQVVKSTIYLTDMNDFARVNQVYASYFNEETAPARETVQVVALPKQVHIEIAMVAIR